MPKNIGFALAALLALGAGIYQPALPTRAPVDTAVARSAAGWSAQVASRSGQERLVLTITADAGTAVGLVTLSIQAGHTRKMVRITTPRRVVQLPYGAMLRLRERPTRPDTWPFNGWRINGKVAPDNTVLARSSISFRIVGATRVTAEYVFLPPTPAPDPTATPTAVATSIATPTATATSTVAVLPTNTATSTPTAVAICRSWHPRPTCSFPPR